MKKIRSWHVVCIIALMHAAPLAATILAKGNETSSTNDKTFATSVNHFLLDHPTATFFATTINTSSTQNGSFAIAKAGRTFGKDRPTFIGIAPESIQNQTIALFTLATFYGSTNPLLSFVLGSDSSAQETTVWCMTPDGKTIMQSAQLLDASGIINQDGQPNMGITAIAANSKFIFAAVKPNMAGSEYLYYYESDELIPDQMPNISEFGQLDSGIAVVCITPNTLELQQAAAVAGDSGIKAKQFDAALAEIHIGTLFSFPNINPNNIAQEYPIMYWDDQLQCLYIGYDVTTSGNVSGIGARSVVAAHIDATCGTLSYAKFAPDAAFITGQETNIIGVRQTGGGNNLNLSVHNLAVLHASTGPSYLIVNGGNGTRSSTGNLLFALPLVDDPSSPATHGTLANKNSALSNGVFTVAASSNADIPTNTDPAALIGAGPFPFAALNELSDLVVIGDTVYASSKIPCTSTNEIGIFYSQALFDETGKIIRWTPWTKRAFPFTGFPGNFPAVSFFEVDAVTGKIWAVGGHEDRILRVTAWDVSTDTSSLSAALNAKLSTGCYSMLDLDQSTRGFLDNTLHRYALFGGNGIVAFTRTSESHNIDNVLSPQIVQTDFSSNENIRCTSLPIHVCVTSLEYSRRGDDCESNSEECLNYFYAGTPQGLFVFADAQGNALNVSQFSTLDQPPLSTASWHTIDLLKNPIIDMQTIGNMLYVLMRTPTKEFPLQTSLVRIPFQSTLNTMFTSGNIITIAQSTTDPVFKNIQQFNALALIATNNDGTEEQIVLATNNGLYRSARSNGIQDAANQTDASWSYISAGDHVPYTGIGSMFTSAPTAAPSTIWPFSLEDPRYLDIYNAGSIHQLSGTMNTGSFAFNPTSFNSIETDNNTLATTYPITYFWSDGARRFYLVRNLEDMCYQKNILVLPFDTIDWNIDKSNQRLLYNDTLKHIYNYHFVQNVGATGIIVAGTPSGVITLE